MAAMSTIPMASSGTPMESFHMKHLPCPPAICSFSSAEGRRIMKEALAAGTAECSFRLLEHFRTQDELAYCGVGTLAMCLNALKIDPGRTWKGPWRWFHEEMLDCCPPVEIVKTQGIVFDQFCSIARCNGAIAEAHRPDVEGETLQHFRQRLISSVSSEEGAIFVVSYSRRALMQTGDGHFSPIAAYHPGLDAALILDVARFKLPPHWVPVPLLWEALTYKDSTTGRCRGYVLLTANLRQNAEAPLLLLKPPQWTELQDALECVKNELQQWPSNIDDAVFVFYKHMRRFGGLVKTREASNREQNSAGLVALFAEITALIAALQLERRVDAKALPWSGCSDTTGDLPYIFAADLLVCPLAFWSAEGAHCAGLANALSPEGMSPRLRTELQRLQAQFLEICTACCRPCRPLTVPTWLDSAPCATPSNEEVRAAAGNPQEPAAPVLRLLMPRRGPTLAT